MNEIYASITACTKTQTFPRFHIDKSERYPITCFICTFFITIKISRLNVLSHMQRYKEVCEYVLVQRYLISFLLPLIPCHIPNSFKED